MSVLIEAVTTFNQDGFEKYGAQFIETFKRHWHGDILLTVYGEGMETPYFEDGERIRWRSYEEHCPEGVAFKTCPRPNPPIVEFNRYRFQVNKFSHKAFALADAMRRTQADYLLLIDADIETFGNVTPEWIAGLLPNDEHVTCLLRPWYHHTECGFVLYRVCGKTRDMGQTIEDVYTTGAVFENDEGWCDSSVFDYVRGRFEKERELVTRDLTNSEQGSGLDVFSNSVLGEKMIHHKGPAKNVSAA